ncbi:hypothetical protein CREGCYN_04470 [Synechococcus sp. M16CYN]
MLSLRFQLGNITFVFKLCVEILYLFCEVLVFYSINNVFGLIVIKGRLLHQVRFCTDPYLRM